MAVIDIWRLEALVGHLAHVIEREQDRDAYRIVLIPDILPHLVAKVLGCTEDDVIFKTTNGHVNVYNISPAVAKRGAALPQNAERLRKLQFLREALEDQDVFIDCCYMYPGKEGALNGIAIKVSAAASEKIPVILGWKPDQIATEIYTRTEAYVYIPWKTLDSTFGYPYACALDRWAIGAGARNVRGLLRYRFKPGPLAEIPDRELTENVAYFRYLVRKAIENTNDTPSTYEEMLGDWVWAEKIVHNRHESDDASLIRMARVVRKEITVGAEKNYLGSIKCGADTGEAEALQNWVQSERRVVPKRSLREFGAIVELDLC